MNGVERGLRVIYDASKDDQGNPAGAGEGQVLDHGPDVGTWWVMPAGATRAVVVSRHNMQARESR